MVQCSAMVEGLEEPAWQHSFNAGLYAQTQCLGWGWIQNKAFAW